MFKVLVITFFLFSNLLFANENILAYNAYNQTLILPKQSEEAKNKIIELISTAKQSINISMYNFSYKKFAKELVQASKNGVKVKLILDKSKVQNDNEIYKSTLAFDLFRVRSEIGGPAFGIAPRPLRLLRTHPRGPAHSNFNYYSSIDQAKTKT